MVLNAETVRIEIQRVITDDPTIDAKRILVSVERRGFLFTAKEVVILKGSVLSDLDKNKAAKIAALHAGGREVVNDLQVQPR